MLDHFSHSELTCPTTDQVRLAAGFGEALEGVCAVLGSPCQLIEQTQCFPSRMSLRVTFLRIHS